MTEQQLEEQLGDLAARLDTPPADPDEMLRLARRRRDRRRGAVLAAAAAVTVVVTGAAALSGQLPGRSAGVAGDDTTASGPDVTPSVAPGETAIPSGTATPSPGGGGSADSERQIVEGMRKAVARHLDPEGVHISGKELANLNVQSSGSGDAVSSLGTRVGWRVPGETGLGMVAVSVSSVPEYSCAVDGSTGATCTSEDVAGLEVTRVLDEEGAEPPAVVYVRSDGYSVSVSFDDLYGNNATAGVSDIDVDDGQVAALLQDPAFTLPGTPGSAVSPGLSGGQVKDRTMAALGDSASSFQDLRWSGTNTEGQVDGRWVVDGAARGDLMVTDGVGNFAVDEPCATWFATRCTKRRVGEVDVRIDYRRQSAGGGFDVTATGPVRTIWVYVDDGGDRTAVLSPDQAVALATDAGLQE